jgi:hypothetical protein
MPHEMGESYLCENIGIPRPELQAINQQILFECIQEINPLINQSSQWK